MSGYCSRIVLVVIVCGLLARYCWQYCYKWKCRQESSWVCDRYFIANSCSNKGQVMSYLRVKEATGGTHRYLLATLNVNSSLDLSAGWRTNGMAAIPKIESIIKFAKMVTRKNRVHSKLGFLYRFFDFEFELESWLWMIRLLSSGCPIRNPKFGRNCLNFL